MKGGLALTSKPMRPGANHAAPKKHRIISLLAVLFLAVFAGGGALYLVQMQRVPTLDVMENMEYPFNLSAGESTESSAVTAASSTASSADTTAASTTTTTVQTSKKPLVSSSLLPEGARADDSYLDDFLFIGDSRINGMRNRGQIKSENTLAVNGLSHSVALTKSCITLNGRQMTIPQAVAVRKPAIMLVAFGINGIAYMSNSGFMEDYEELIDKLQAASPDSILIIQAILPVSTAYVQKDSRFANDKIDRYNEQLLDLAEEKGAYFLNTAEVMKNAENALDAAYDSGDGLHFSTEAGEVILEYILTHPVTA